MRIAIVNNVKMTVEMMKRIIASNKNLALAWVAFTGKEAIEKSSMDTPDLILMSLDMHDMNGAEVTGQIMSQTPCAILLVTPSFNSNVGMVFKAMGYGALDVVRTPILDLKSSTFGGEDLLYKIDKIACLIGKGVKKKITHGPNGLKSSQTDKSEYPHLLVIGSSTGGPMALSKLLSSFPQSPSFATIIIQHVDSQFAPSFAKWLSGEVLQKVEIAKENMEIKKGAVLIAGKNEHLVINETKTLHYSKHPKDNPFRPSVDVFFQSVAKHWPQKSVAILLTGMGSDGAKGMKALFEVGWHTIAQHRNSCIVYGMPKAAIEANAIASVLPLDQIGPDVLSFFEAKERKINEFN